MQRPSGHKRGYESGQRRMMPATLANPRECRFAESHLKFVPKDQSYDQFAAIAFCAFTAGERRGKDVRWMRWILLPINIVVIHTADHQRVGKRGRDRINLLSRADHGRWSAACDLVQHLERNFDIVLLISTKRAADGIEEETFRLEHRILREMAEIERSRPARHFRCDCFFCGNSFFRCGHDFS